MAIGNLSDLPAADVYIGGPVVIEWFQPGDGSMKPGFVAMEDDADEIKIAAAGTTQPFCVVGLLPWHDLDTVYLIGSAATGEAIFGYLLGVGTKLRVAKDGGTEALAKANSLITSDRDAGHVGVGTTTALKVGKAIRTVAAGRFKWVQIISVGA